MEMHKPVGYDRCLSMHETPPPYRGRHFHDISWLADRASMVFPDHHRYPVVMDNGLPFLGRREGVG